MYAKKKSISSHFWNLKFEKVLLFLNKKQKTYRPFREMLNFKTEKQKMNLNCRSQQISNSFFVFLMYEIWLARFEQIAEVTLLCKCYILWKLSYDAVCFLQHSTTFHNTLDYKRYFYIILQVFYAVSSCFGTFSTYAVGWLRSIQ